MEILLDWIENAAKKMETLNSNSDPSSRIMLNLRELQLLISPLMLAEVDKRTRFIIFFLNSYIDSIFMDLLGDIPDDPDGSLHDIRCKFFEDVKKGFAALLSKMRDSKNPLPAVEALVVAYAKAVKNLNYRDIQMGGRNE
jgi:hypothetical protein